MVKTVHIENFRSIRNLTLRLGPLTAFVGPNASGKTTVLQALMPYRRIDEAAVWRHDLARTVRVRISLENGSQYQFAGTAGHAWDGWHPVRYQLARFDVDKLRLANQVAQAAVLDESGSNLANVFGTLTRRKQESVATALRRVVPVFGDVDVLPTAHGHHELRFQDRWDTSVWYRPVDVSDGTMLMLAYLVLQHQAPPTQLLCVEEPDRGLHPYLLGELVNLFRGMSHGSIGPAPVQIVLATHSADLLDRLRPEEVRFFSRDPADGAVTVEEVDPTAPDWQEAYAEYKESLGDVWLSGGVGGVP